MAAGLRLIARRERRTPAQSFTDVDEHRFQCFVTEQRGATRPQARHRAHAIVESQVAQLQAG